MNKKSSLVFILSICLFSCGADTDILYNITPNTAFLVFPENGLECTEGVALSETESEVIFRWKGSESVIRYDLQLTNLFSGTIETISTTEMSIPITLLRGTPYSWNIISNSKNRSVLSESWSFYNAGIGVSAYIPFPAKNISPLEGVSIDASEITIDLLWEASDLDNDIVEYDVYFGTNSLTPSFLEKTTNNFISDITIQSETIYYWKITTIDSIGNESNSQIFSFTVE